MKPTLKCYKLALLLSVATLTLYQPPITIHLSNTTSFNTINNIVKRIVSPNLIATSNGTLSRFIFQKSRVFTSLYNLAFSVTIYSSKKVKVSTCSSDPCVFIGINYIIFCLIHFVILLLIYYSWIIFI